MTRTDVYLSATIAFALFLIGLTIQITGLIVTDEVGPVIVTGTATTATGAIATLVTGYRATRRYFADRVNRAAALLVRDVLAHDVRLATEPQPPDAEVIPFETQARRPSRESTT
ncbi:hypothetical protein [Streptomyces similanensis]|uniref:Uncharacterized protein n=1 Tax=Streptomyces similanensis TaxID=1274988 RepID=A0ABP9KGC9_9ACTN